MCYSLSMSNAMYDEEMQYEEDARYGDPRKCSRHPHIKTSSGDGMFDAPCGACEAEMDEED